MEAVCYSSRSSACRRELNSHGAAKPRVPACPRQRAPVKNQGIPVRQLGDLIPCPSMSSNDMEPPQYVVPAHRVGGPGVRSVRQAVITGAAAPTDCCVGANNAKFATACSAEREATGAHHEKGNALARPAWRAHQKQRCLTPRST